MAEKKLFRVIVLGGMALINTAPAAAAVAIAGCATPMREGAPPMERPPTMPSESAPAPVQTPPPAQTPPPEQTPSAQPTTTASAAPVNAPGDAGAPAVRRPREGPPPRPTGKSGI